MIMKLFQFIRTHVAVKLGLLLLSVFLLVMLALGNILYSLFLTFYLSHTTEELVQRAHSHAAVLSDHFDRLTIDHVVRMEQGSLFMVVILDEKGEVLGSSDTITPLHRPYLKEAAQRNLQEEYALEQDWRTKPFLVSRSAILGDGKEIGTVVLFSPTAPIREAIGILQGMLLGIGGITVIIVTGILFILSRMVVRPLLEMKKVTGEIAKGRYQSRILVTGEDEVSQLAASINHMSKEIQFYQKQRNEFLADIGHELRTPLTYLKGYSEIVLQTQLSKEEQKEYIGIIHEQSKRLQRLVQDLFELARMEQGDFSFRKERLSLEEVITNVLTFVESSMDEKGIALEYQSPKTKPIVEGDPQRLEQLFINILENARRYTPRNGIIEVRYGGDVDHITVQIRDSGPGIPKDELPFIMERLYRVEKSRSLETGGTGLGLAICKKIVEMHKGEIWVESIEGKGTTFFVRLPLINWV
ncbi:sensor histidine kinase [Ammoniphilus resinae]|uniref:histidine kinase n=1 Tax=Ammoniphilus resinae TaxID=861532 RepID=A0ABS4GMM7_9BACL|nr:HAMP domain-containing sensor histidine kinase [Ammoniphilus resinae]MBP1931120.1 signal transduction histidine kinase [Ammoniphilus resinae]